MLRFVKKIFVIAMVFFSCNILNVYPLKCVLMNNQECKIRPEIIKLNSNGGSFFPYRIKVNKYSGISCNISCNNINYSYAKLGVCDVVKNINVKVFNLMSRTNKTKHIEWHETCKCNCRLDTGV